MRKVSSMISKNNSIKYKVNCVPNSTVACKFILCGCEYDIEVDILLYLYCIGPDRKTKVITSNTEKVYTREHDKEHTIVLNIPPYDGYVSIKNAFIFISFGSGDNNGSVSIKDLEEVDPCNVEDKCNIVDIDNTSDSIYTYNGSKDNILFISTWNTECGIATYTEHLRDALIRNASSYNVRGDVGKLFSVLPVNNGFTKDNISARLVHIQHEFGIISRPPDINGGVVITWHTVLDNHKRAIIDFESSLNVKAHIVHSEAALKSMQSSKDVYVVNHGSEIIPQISIDHARKFLRMDRIINNKDARVGFVFGFQSPNKNYNRIIDAAKNTGVHLIISGAAHRNSNKSNIINNENVTFLNRFLTDTEIDLYALASNMLIFDYNKTKNYSCSGALHRTIGAGRPVICSDINHFLDVREGIDVLKFSNQTELEKCIDTAIDKQNVLSTAALEYAKNTSWDIIARKHIDIYKKYTNI